MVVVLPSLTELNLGSSIEVSSSACGAAISLQIGTQTRGSVAGAADCQQLCDFC